MPCSLCGAPIPHTLAEPFNVAKLIFRATIRGRDAWLPMKHAGPLCPDPPTETAAFWDDDTKRENYKRERREAAARSVTWRS